MNTLTAINEYPTAQQITDMYYQAYGRLATARNTHENYKYAVIAYQKYNGNQTDITFAGMQRMVDGLLDDGKSPDTINQYIGRLSRVIEWAVKATIYKYNFLDSALFPRLKTVEKLHQNVTDTMDFDDILGTVTDIRDRAIMVLIGIAGLRKSEVVAVDKSDVHRLPDGGYKILIRAAKNGKQRWAVLSREYESELKMYMEAVPDGPLFTAKATGNRLDARSINYIVKRYGDYSPHKYRHRCAETLYQNNASIDDISSMLGNSPSVCARVYAGVDINRQINTASLLKRKAIE